MVEKYKLAGKDFSKVRAFYHNSIYSVQVYKAHSGGFLMGIRRNDESTEVPWAHKQRIKNEIFGEEVVAVEVFPPVSELVDAANLYWLWTMEAEVFQDYNFKGFRL